MINILIVEDEKPISNLIRLSLTKERYHCTCAFNGMEAVDYIEKNRYDLIILDVMLPEIDGFELMDYIRPLEIPVIFLTAKGSVQDRVKGLKLGAEDYIVKPFEVVELLARMDVVLRRYKKCDMVLEINDGKCGHTCPACRLARPPKPPLFMGRRCLGRAPLRPAVPHIIMALRQRKNFLKFFKNPVPKPFVFRFIY